MARLVLEDGEGCFYWQIDGLSYPFNKSNYVEVGVTLNSFSSGTEEYPGRVDWVPAPISGSDYGVDKQEAVLQPGTYTLYGYSKTNDSNWVRYWSVGSGAVTVKPLTAARPKDWEWLSEVQKGKPIKLSASEWEAFQQRIDEFRTYKGLEVYGTWNTPKSGDPISAFIVNQAREAISPIPGCGTLPSKAVSGEPITAAFFNGLESALNFVE